MAKDNENQSTSGDTNQARGSASLATRTHEVADEVRQATLERVGSVRDSALTAKRNAAERVRKLGATVRKIGEHLRIEDQRYIAERANGLSESLDDFAGYLNASNFSKLVRDTSAVARRSPTLFFGGAFVVGLAAGRFLKDDGADPSADTEPTSGVQRLPASSPRSREAARGEQTARRQDTLQKNESTRSGASR